MTSVIQSVSGAVRRSGRGVTLLLTFGLCVVSILAPLAQRGVPVPARPGLQRDGITLLPNGWRIAPVGHHVQVGDLPLNMIPSPDGRFLVITNNGWAKPTKPASTSAC